MWPYLIYHCFNGTLAETTSVLPFLEVHLKFAIYQFSPLIIIVVNLDLIQANVGMLLQPVALQQFPNLLLLFIIWIVTL